MVWRLDCWGLTGASAGQSRMQAFAGASSIARPFAFARRTLTARLALRIHQLVDDGDRSVGKIESANQRIGESGDQLDELGLVAGAGLGVQPEQVRPHRRFAQAEGGGGAGY